MAVQVVDPSEIPNVADPQAGTAGDDVLARRAALHALHDSQESSGKIDLTRATAEPAPVREPIDFVTIQTPSGEIEFGPPPGVSLTMRIAMMTGEDTVNRLQSALLRTMMCVRKINGRIVTPITSMVEAQFLANQLGDPTLDFLFQTMNENWPPPARGELQVISKNKRVT